ncbi:MAG TPA: non-canonical purine NTP pyrophosphatase [Candidatus Saccharimonadales bacterium]|nr:non-canonical purine NTP pyrophosphatase [Candidatus Saccharimonadales bacterium]
MNRIPVDSSDIVSVGYDARARILEIEFGGGRIYQYTDVPPDVHERFMRADSFGGFFNSFINGHFRYHRVNDNAAQPEQGRPLAFVSGNAGKLRALQAAFAPFQIEVEQLDLPVDEIQATDPEKIALHKAKQAYKLAGRPVLVQDTYWNILALRGFPGAYMHDVAQWLKPEDFLALLKGKTDRTAIRTHTVVYYDGKRSKVLSKDFSGVVIDEARGSGPSIEQLVVTAGQTRTNAELADAHELTIPVEDSVWHEFAKWYNMQRRLGKA